MKITRILLFAILPAIVAVSCKKEENSDTTAKQLTGTLSFEALPKYVNPGMTFDFDASAVALPEDETDPAVTLKYIFNFSLSAKPDTLFTPYYTLTIPDELGSFTLRCTVSAPGYGSATSSVNSTIVSGKSLVFDAPEGEIRIPDGGGEFGAVENGGLLWMTSNYSKSGTAYYREPAMLGIFGSYYSWNEAENACPDGWSIPTLEQWDALSEDSGALMCDVYFNGGKMWEFWPAVRITNSTGLCAIPVGYAEKRENLYNFAGLNEYAVFWADDGGKASCRYIFVSDPQPKTFVDIDPENFLASLRCVKVADR